MRAPAKRIRRDGKLYMFYAGGYNNEPQQVGVAVSTDGVTWTLAATEIGWNKNGPYLK